MARVPFFASVLVLLPTMALAQTWETETIDTGGLIYGGVSAPQYSLVFSCNSPSPQRRPLFETADHETIRNAPFGLHVRLGSALVPPPDGEGVLPAVTVIADGTGHRLPPVRWDGLYGQWMVELSMIDPVIPALSDAADLVLDSGTGMAWRYPVDGLAQGLSAAISACSAGWMQAGLALPPELGGAASPSPAAAGPMTPEIDAFLRLSCSTPYTIDARAIALHDLDRDGQPDRIVDWAGVTCAGSTPRPFCGAANCSIEVFLSSRPGEPQSFIGVGYTVTQAANGAPGLRFGGTAGACARGECDRIFWWDGSRFRQ